MPSACGRLLWIQVLLKAYKMHQNVAFSGTKFENFPGRGTDPDPTPCAPHPHTPPWRTTSAQPCTRIDSTSPRQTTDSTWIVLYGVASVYCSSDLHSVGINEPSRWEAVPDSRNHSKPCFILAASWLNSSTKQSATTYNLLAKVTGSSNDFILQSSSFYFI